MLSRPIPCTTIFVEHVAQILRRATPKTITKEEDSRTRRAAVVVPLVRLKTEAARAHGLEEGELGVLFTLRSQQVGTHKGQVSFPGGHVEEGETPEAAALRELVEELWEPCLSQHGTVVSVVQTALLDGSNRLLAGEPDRAGLKHLFGPFAGTRVLGRGDDARAVTGTIVSPIVAAVEHSLQHPIGSSLKPSEEVETAFALPVRQLLDPAHAHLQRITYTDPAVVAARLSRAVDESDRTDVTGYTPDPRHDQSTHKKMTIDIPVFTGGPAPVWGLTAMLLDRLLSSVILPALADSGHHLQRPKLTLRAEADAHD